MSPHVTGSPVKIALMQIPKMLTFAKKVDFNVNKRLF